MLTFEACLELERRGYPQWTSEPTLRWASLRDGTTRLSVGIVYPTPAITAAFTCPDAEDAANWLETQGWLIQRAGGGKVQWIASMPTTGEYHERMVYAPDLSTLILMMFAP